MILADTNIWCDFFRKGDDNLDRLLAENQVVMHSLVIGELAMGNLPDRSRTLQDLNLLMQLPEASHRECFTLLETHMLYGKGLQWNDLQILCSVLLHAGTRLWTRDCRLAEVAEMLAVGYAV